MHKLIWKTVPVSRTEVSLNRVLRCGQAFRWKNVDGIWSCTLRGRVVFLKQDDFSLHYSSLWPQEQYKDDVLSEEVKDDTLELITEYLNLKIKIADLYTQWSANDANFQKHAKTFSGIRILRQDPWENLVSFICLTNNNVKRISQMCDKLCVHFGDYINTFNSIKYYDFPTPHSLAVDDSVEHRLRELGFGYRAKYIHRTAKQVVSSPDGISHLYGLRDQDYKTAHAALLAFTGVGPKVADCVCLMSLDKHDVVPVDTHVWTIAQRDYKFKSGLKIKTLSQKIYEETGDFFRSLWGPYAGWAHSVLFAADLSDLNNGINVVDGVQTLTNKKRRKIKSVTVIDSELRDVKIEFKQEESVIYGPSGRPLRGKRRLKVLEARNL